MNIWQRTARIIVLLTTLFSLTAPFQFAVAETIQCGPDEASTCEKSEKECLTHSDCSAGLFGKGNSRCFLDYCYFDTTAKAVLEANQTEAFGFTIKNEIGDLKKPALQIKFPGLNFSDTKQTLDNEGYINIPYIGEFITALYKYGIAIGSIIAVVIIIKNGVSIILSAGGEEKMAAYHQIGQVVIGLIIMWGSYAFLYTINSTLVEFKPLRIKYIAPITVEHEDDVVEGQPPTANVVPVHKNIKVGEGVVVAADILSDLQAVADELAAKKITLYITSGLRTIEKQKELIAKNCENPPGSATCKPKEPNGVPTCILKDNDPKNCPHTTGRAVDVWGYVQGKQCILQEKCSSNPDNDACRKDPCQAAVIEAMRNQGFCNLSIEAWHFEKPKMSSKCT